MRLFSALLLASGFTGSLFAQPAISLHEVGRHNTGVFRKSAAEIPAYCALTRRLFVVNAHSGNVDVLDLTDPARPRPLAVLETANELGGGMAEVNSIAIHNGLLAAAVAAAPKTDAGKVAFYHTSELRLLASAAVGSLPDQLTFSPDGRWVLVANEGEPNADYTVDPEGGVSLLDLSGGMDGITVRTAGFRDWNEGGPRAGEVPALRGKGLRFFGQVTLDLESGATRPSTFAEDMEPEWIEITADSLTAYVMLQEANAIAELSIPEGRFTRILPLGFKDHGQPGNELDVSDRDDGIHLRLLEGLYGVYQPDTFRLFERDGVLYAVTANEGDSRVRPEDDDSVPGKKEGEIFSCEVGLDAFDVSGTPFESLSGAADLGRLRLVSDLVREHADSEGRPTRLFAYGGRSFSIFRLDNGERVFDSGADFERITAERAPALFNVSNHRERPDERSRSKGPEPEGVALGEIDGRLYAFIGLERSGGVMIYDITEPAKSRFVDYVNTRVAGVPPQLEDKSHNPAAGDLGPEGLIFISAADSPNGKDLLVVSNEVSGSTVVFEVR